MPALNIYFPAILSLQNTWEQCALFQGVMFFCLFPLSHSPPGFLPAGKEYISPSRARVKPRPRPRNRRRRVKAPAVCLSRQGSGGGGEAKRDTQPHNRLYIAGRAETQRAEANAPRRTNDNHKPTRAQGAGGRRRAERPKSGTTPPPPFYARGRAGTA